MMSFADRSTAAAPGKPDRAAQTAKTSSTSRFQWNFPGAIWNGSRPRTPQARFPVIFIHCPDYTHRSSGVRCLFLLCHHLNRLGYEAYVTGRNAPEHLIAPHMAPSRIEEIRQQGIDDIVVYPEITSGNPLGGEKVVRFLLNKPGVLNEVDVQEYGRKDYAVHFSREFRHELLSSRRLTIPLVDQEVFNCANASVKREGFLLYSARYRPDLRTLPDWVGPFTIVSSAHPLEAETLAQLYRQNRALVVWEPTAAIAEAMHCGCPVIMIPRSGFNHLATARRCFWGGLVVGWHKRMLWLARCTLPIAIWHYKFGWFGLDRRLHRFVAHALRHFENNENRSPRG